jgi:hypothetical protein
MRRRLILITLVLAVGLVLSLVFAMAIAQVQNSPAGTAKEKEVVVTMEVSGRVSGLSPNFIAVIYGRDDTGKVSLEMAFNLDKDVKVAHKNSIKEIGLGDEVKITYAEITRFSAEGKMISRRRVAKEVAFVRAAKTEQQTGVVESKSETEVLESKPEAGQ